MHIYPQRERLQGSEGLIFNLVSHSATPEQWAEWLRVPLEHAAARGNLDLVTILLNAGASVTAGWRGGCRGRTVIDAAAVGGNADVVSTLLFRAGGRADAGVVSVSSGRSALYTAIKCGHESAAQRLIAAGWANIINYRDPIDDCTPLLRAVLDGHEHLAKELLNAGAFPNMRGDGQRGWAPLHVAASRGQTGVLSALLANGADKEALDDRGASSLHHAIARHQIGSVQRLLAAGADISAGGSFPALMFAARVGSAIILKAILDHGADVNFRSPTGGRTALHAACCSPHIIRMLINAGAEVDAQRFDGGTPLHYAAASSSHEAMHALVQCGADVNARHNITDQTALHMACQHQARGVDSAVDLLLRLGAIETAVGGDGRTALDLLELPNTASGKGCSVDEKQRARTLLAGAKQDRAWRRRWLPVILRSRALKKVERQLSNNSRGMSASLGTASKEIFLGHPHILGVTMRPVGEEGNSAGEFREDGRIVKTVVAVGSAYNDRRAGSRVTETLPGSVMAMLVDVKSDGVFRTVVGFM